MNIRDIARLANVTPGTVSKVLNNYPDISEATRQHVLQIIKENQYTTKNGGRKFKQAVTPRIGLVSENVYNWVSETMQNLLSVRFHNADYTVLSFQDNYFSQNKKTAFRSAVFLGEGIFTMGYSKNYIMYWGVFTVIIVASVHE